MIILVDMTVKTGADLAILMKELMVDIWAAEVVATKAVCLYFFCFYGIGMCILWGVAISSLFI